MLCFRIFGVLGVTWLLLGLVVLNRGDALFKMLFCDLHRMPGTLVWGTANPEGMGPDYNGVYLTSLDIKSMIDQVNEAKKTGKPIPVHLEHKGVELGEVISAWEHDGTMQCVLELNDRVLEGSIGGEFVKNGLCKDLSLGYTMEVAQSKDKRKLDMRKKKLTEISVVKKGARKKCHIHGFAKQ